MKRFNEEYFAMVKEEQGEDVANLCKVVHEFLNDITERQECKESMSFSEEKSKLTELVAPFGLVLGDDNGGFATGTKWYDNDNTLWVSWNTWKRLRSMIRHFQAPEVII